MTKRSESNRLIGDIWIIYYAASTVSEMQPPAKLHLAAEPLSAGAKVFVQLLQAVLSSHDAVYPSSYINNWTWVHGGNLLCVNSPGMV